MAILLLSMVKIYKYTARRVYSRMIGCGVRRISSNVSLHLKHVKVIRGHVAPVEQT